MEWKGITYCISAIPEKRENSPLRPHVLFITARSALAGAVAFPLFRFRH